MNQLESGTYINRRGLPFKCEQADIDEGRITLLAKGPLSFDTGLKDQLSGENLRTTLAENELAISIGSKIEYIKPQPSRDLSAKNGKERENESVDRALRLISDGERAIQQANEILKPIGTTILRTGNVDLIREFANKLPKQSAVRREMEKLAQQIEAGEIPEQLLVILSL